MVFECTDMENARFRLLNIQLETTTGVDERVEILPNNETFKAVFESANIVTSHLLMSEVARGAILNIALNIFFTSPPAKKAFRERRGVSELNRFLMIGSSLQRQPADSHHGGAQRSGPETRTKATVAWGRVDKTTERNDMMIPIDQAARYQHEQGPTSFRIRCLRDVVETFSRSLIFKTMSEGGLIIVASRIGYRVV
ncbi:hypothetical protein B0H15DRAFT_603705 [Mycena belliarum]|uniref:Uncharacterized protein n=1 Tax=Mycena belliarum TaxID=1033014 RepID=A0AAD6TRE8_9AGAR|nr:hypothetical protein B0H15DRAFT_603705 [Mycena belliae]